jgi:hypothetical protein
MIMHSHSPRPSFVNDFPISLNKFKSKFQRPAFSNTNSVKKPEQKIMSMENIQLPSLNRSIQFNYGLPTSKRYYFCINGNKKHIQIKYLKLKALVFARGKKTIRETGMETDIKENYDECN